MSTNLSDSNFNKESQPIKSHSTEYVCILQNDYQS